MSRLKQESSVEHLKFKSRLTRLFEIQVILLR